MLQVLKFGGTSVGSAQRIKELTTLTVNEVPKIVVLSAMSGTTNALAEISQSLSSLNTEHAMEQVLFLEQKYLTVVHELFSKTDNIKKAEGWVKDCFRHISSLTQRPFTEAVEKEILAQGELLSTTLFHHYLEEINVESVLLPALNFMRITEHGEPDMDYIEQHIQIELRPYSENKLFITQGYICRNISGAIDNLKRGGSDYTASIIGAAIRSPEIQIWTDIDGMHNNDPRFVSKTYPIEALSFDEAAELAYFGAKILHPTCILPAQKRNIPVRLKNTMQPEAPGTLIAQGNNIEGIKAVAAKDGITAINIRSDRMLLAHGFLRAVFAIFEHYHTAIDMITTSEVAVSLTIDNAQYLDDIIICLKEIAQVDIDPNQTIICIVGQLPKDKPGYANKVLDALKDIPLRMVSYGGSLHNISVLVNSDLKVPALNALNKALFHH